MKFYCWSLFAVVGQSCGRVRDRPQMFRIRRNGWFIKYNKV